MWKYSCVHPMTCAFQFTELLGAVSGVSLSLALFLSLFMASFGTVVTHQKLDCPEDTCVLIYKMSETSQLLQRVFVYCIKGGEYL